MSKRRFFGVRVAVRLGLLFASSCSSETVLPDVDNEAEGSGGTLLTRGSRGADVEWVQAYLTTFGYLPNDELAAEYPQWRPPVTETPAQGVFDEPTALAVGQLQRNFGLQETGMVDQATLDVMDQPRCGFPDNVSAIDASSKFHIEFSDRPSLIYYAAGGSDGGISDYELKEAADAAIDNWRRAQSDVAFSRDDSGVYASLIITFEYSEESYVGKAGRYIRLNSRHNFVIGDSDEGYDVESILTHEIGHYLGLGHSSQNDAGHPTMWPATGKGDVRGKTLSLDDKVAIRAAYGAWTTPPDSGGADVGVGPLGETWTIGSGNTAGGKEIFFYDSADNRMRKDPNAGALRITVDSTGRPWAVNSAKQVFRRKSRNITTTGWDLMPGTGNDIGASITGEVWKIGTSNIAGSNFNISQWEAASNQWVDDNSGGSAVRIAVDQEGRPWVVNSAGNVFRRKHASVRTVSEWKIQTNTLAYDIGVNNPVYPVIVSRNGFTIGNITAYDILVRNFQDASSSGSPPPPARDTWVKLAGGMGTAVAVGDADFRVWKISASGLSRLTP